MNIHKAAGANRETAGGVCEMGRDWARGWGGAGRWAGGREVGGSWSLSSSVQTPR